MAEEMKFDDVYRPDGSGEIMYVEVDLDSDETIEITAKLELNQITEDLHEELKKVTGYDGTERVFMMKTKCCTSCLSLVHSGTRKNEDDGRFVFLVLEDATGLGRDRQKKRTKNAVTDIDKK